MRVTRIKLDQIPEAQRPAAAKAGRVRGDWLEIEADKLARLLGGTSYTSPTSYPSPQNPKTWPAWATAISLLKTDADKGVGDTVERTVGPFGGRAFKLAAKTLGWDCGCRARRDDWNRRFPY